MKTDPRRRRVNLQCETVKAYCVAEVYEIKPDDLTPRPPPPLPKPKGRRRAR